MKPSFTAKNWLQMKDCNPDADFNNGEHVKSQTTTLYYTLTAGGISAHRDALIEAVATATKLPGLRTVF